ncbi:MAG: 50S ribosomal protein L29 [Methylococcaceae bacterium]|jgi:large subunit ribosomal protein L29|nr:50S ribosomal protein L29 [Methylococcaceae bacterium]MDZ4157087.1 50S ribosomal protein L29 [Methylococcales bacterium]MDP2394158.1 50S ribosomal protein L29 [Methylococcaceae bacterium]MDP3019986.1 50S ribosomal protein L29 [Methylococcaceae bacterium]MDP3388728.1 50S ribosomal protein L29 [Methylococcaceae bacterium]
MNVKELRNKTDEELKLILVDLSREHFNLRVQKATAQLSKTHLIKRTKRSVAKVLTVLTEKARV